LSSTTRTTACLWCGHEETYSPNRKASVTRCKARMAKHEKKCVESPMVKQAAKLRKTNAKVRRANDNLAAKNKRLVAVNRELTKAFQRKKGRMLEQYLNPRRYPEGPPVEMLKELGTLARGTVLDDDVLVSINRENPSACVICDTTEDVCPLRVKARTVTHVAPLCANCMPKPGTDSYVAKLINATAEKNKHECAFLWEISGRVQMLYGEELSVETIR